MPTTGTMLKFFLVVLPVVLADGASALARECPYEAIVESDTSPARCGPGKKYYVTSKLKRGDRVTVRRQDLGGWFMIDPPPGSFSLIRAADVERDGGGYVGMVKRLDQGQAAVRVGSEIDPTADSILQRELSSGERVEILGDTRIPHRDTQVHMLKIRPPKGEFRWIEGKYLAPLDPPKRSHEVTSVDPFAAPPQTRPVSGENTQRRVVTIPAVANSTINSTPPAAFPAVPELATPGEQNPQASSANPAPSDPLSRLEQLDSEFREMIRRQPTMWKLGPLEQAYRELQRQSSEPAIVSQIERRLSTISRYKRVKAEYDDYFLLVSSTSRKDAELAAVQYALVPQYSRPPIDPAATPAPSNGMPRNAVPQNTVPRNTVAQYGLPQNVLPQNSLPQGVLPPNGFAQNSVPQNNFPPNGFGQNNLPPNALAQNNVAPNSPPQNSFPQNIPPQNGGVSQNGSANGFANGPPAAPPNGNPSNPQYPPSALPQSATQPQPNAPALNGPVLGLPAKAYHFPQAAPEANSPGSGSSASPQGPVLNSTAPNAANSDGSNAPAPFVPVPTEPLVPNPAPNNPAPNNLTQNNLTQNNPAQNNLAQNNPVSTNPPGSPASEPSAGSAPSGPVPAQATTVSPPELQQNPSISPNSSPMSNPPAVLNPAIVQSPRLLNASATPPLAPPLQVRPQNGLDGAGIVQRAATPIPGGPQHVLLAPNGRILAYLYPDRGVNLDAHLGQSLGVIGPRSFRPEWQTDLIIVRRLVPVRLVP